MARNHAHAFLLIIHELARGAGWKVPEPSWLNVADLGVNLAAQAIESASRAA
jgi:hypothetical protein